MSHTPYIFNVQRYSIHDGPGIRTVIFLKGCPLRCEWCSNPESQSPQRNIFFNPMLCIGCRTCEKMCPHHIPLGEQGIHKDCTKCGICARYCPSKALETMGEERSITSLVEEAARDEIYYRKSGGGVTISGGEALLYPEFTAELAEALKKEHYHVALETTGFAPWSDADFVFSRFDLLLYDVKHMNDRVHREFTGVSNEQILKNLKRAAWKKYPVIIRVPLIEGFNATEENMAELGAFAVDHHIGTIHFLPYHTYGEYKYNYLRRKYDTQVSRPSDEKIEALKEQLEDLGLAVKIDEA